MRLRQFHSRARQFMKTTIGSPKPIEPNRDQTTEDQDRTDDRTASSPYQQSATESTLLQTERMVPTIVYYDSAKRWMTVAVPLMILLVLLAVFLRPPLFKPSIDEDLYPERIRVVQVPVGSASRELDALVSEWPSLTDTEKEVRLSELRKTIPEFGSTVQQLRTDVLLLERIHPVAGPITAISESNGQWGKYALPMAAMLIGFFVSSVRQLFATAARRKKEQGMDFAKSYSWALQTESRRKKGERK